MKCGQRVKYSSFVKIHITGHSELNELQMALLVCKCTIPVTNCFFFFFFVRPFSNLEAPLKSLLMDIRKANQKGGMSVVRLELGWTLCTIWLGSLVN